MMESQQRRIVSVAPDLESATPPVSKKGPPSSSPFMTSNQVDSQYSYEQRRSIGRYNECLATASAHAFFSGILKHNASLIRKIGAEFIGTFIMVFGAVAAPIVNQKYNGVETLLGNAASAGLAVMVVILSTGHISGAHLNPSVTIAFAALRHFPWTHVPPYIAAQVSGSICASFALKGIYHPFLSGGVTVPSVTTTQAFFTEFVITFILQFVITAVATDTRAVGELAGIAIGATVLLNILITGPTTGASMNPVRTLGPAVAAGNYEKIWIYMVAPPLGAITGAAMYTIIKLN